MKKISLQLKFLIVMFLNITINLIPVFCRRFYLRFYGIIVEKKSTIHRNVKFFHIGNFYLKKNSTINFGCYMDNRRDICIGENVGIAHNTKIYTLGHDIDSPIFATKGASVHIEDNVFIFSNCLIMPGVRIKEGAVILPGSVVTKSVDAYTVVGGNPAKFIRNRNSEIDYNQNYRYLFAL